MNIGILTGCASDKHLSIPVYDELKLLGMNPYFIQLTQNNMIDSYHAANYDFKYHATKFEFVLAVGDRKEQIGGVLAAFQNNIPIGHLYAGDLNTGVSDDIHRSAITLYSQIQFCSCLESTENTVRLMRSAGLVPDANYVGATHFDGIRAHIEDIKNDKFGIHNDVKPYVLILINSETKGNDEKLVEETITKFMSLCTNGIPNIIIAKGNGDNEDIETSIFTKLMRKTNVSINIVRDNRHNHNFFLSLIANCDDFITNSSAAIYEAPMLLEEKRIILVGNRNKNRTKITELNHDGKASQRVAKLIKMFLETRS